jgi:predicted ribosome quality control (RQC) complex YloA/Tae2 family protein
MKSLNWFNRNGDLVKITIIQFLFFAFSCSEYQQSLYNQANVLEARWNLCNHKMQNLEICLAKSALVSSQVKKEIRKIKKNNPSYNYLLDSMQQSYTAKVEKINKLSNKIHKTLEESNKDKVLYNEYLIKLLDGDYNSQDAEDILSKYKKSLKKYEKKLASYQKEFSHYTNEHDEYIDVIKSRIDIFNGDKIRCDIKID